MNNFDLLYQKIKNRVPGFEIKHKSENKFLKFLSKILFFNKNFMDRYITTLGTKIYWDLEKCDKDSAFIILAHEYVHIMDYIKNPIKFVLGYLFPQILALLSLFTILSFISPYFLFCLLFLLFLAPLPSLPRTKIELRGYGMSVRLRKHLGFEYNDYSKMFTSAAYYFMWPFKKRILKELDNSEKTLNWNIDDPNVAYRDVYEII